MKVQYPGIDVAIENDLKSLSLLESFASPLMRRYHTKETLDEIRSRSFYRILQGRRAKG